MIKFNSDKFVGLLLIFLCGIFILIGLLTSGTFDSGDSTYHYLHAKYALKYPSILLDHWAKPLFTLISVPFASVGFNGMKIMNTIICISSAWFIYLSAKKLEIRNAILIPIILFSAPVFFLVQYSGLTEPLFALFLTIGLYFCLVKKPFIAAIFISFLPFVRTEGQIVMIIYAFYFIFSKQWKGILFLSVGNIFYGIVGLIAKNDFFFTFHENAYAKGSDNYGSGGLFHFVYQLSFQIGFPLFVLFCIGLIYFIFTIFQIKKLAETPYYLEKIFLVLGVYAAYFISHSIFWWQGWFHSFGLSRVLLAIYPLGSVIILIGFNFLVYEIFVKKTQIQKIVYSLLLIVVAIFPFLGTKASFKFNKNFSLSNDQILLNDVAFWYKNSGIDASHIYYSHQYLAIPMGIDPFDKNLASGGYLRNNDSIIHNSIIVWDQFFSVIEDDTPEDTIKNLKDVELIKTFTTGEKEKPYQIKVYYKK